MDFLNENASIGSLVAKKPEFASFFEKLGLDYCCKGNKTLKEACSEKSLNVSEILQGLKQMPTSDENVDWDQMPLKEIIEHIINTYHAFSRQEMPRISQLLEKVNTKHAERHPYISEVKDTFEEMKDSFLKHIDEEEQDIFPLIMKLSLNEECDKEKVKSLLNSLDEDHIETGKALEKIKELTNNYTPPQSACMTHVVMLDSLRRLEKNLHEHIHKENQVLFARAKMTL